MFNDILYPRDTDVTTGYRPTYYATNLTGKEPGERRYTARVRANIQTVLTDGFLISSWPQNINMPTMLL